jgi:hypothetical protein
MLSTTEKGTSQRGNGNSIVPLAGLRADVIRSLEATFPGSLSEETRWLLGKTCGLIADGFGSIDFTGQWHPEEPLGIFRPCLTLANDDDGRRWIAETWRSRRRGSTRPFASGLFLPGPDPARGSAKLAAVETLAAPWCRSSAPSRSRRRTEVVQ